MERFKGKKIPGGEEGGCHPHKVFLSFFLEDKTSAPRVLSSCSYVPRADFEISLLTEFTKVKSN